MSLEQRINQRIKEAEKAQSAMSKIVRSAQGALYGLLSDYFVENMDTDGGAIKQSVSNFGKVGGIFRVFSGFDTTYKGSVFGGVLNYALGIIGLNRSYFEDFESPTETIDKEAIRLTMLRWGYNTNTGQLIDGGYFSMLFNNQAVSQKVASVVNQAIASKMDLQTFQKTFRRVFVAMPGQGMLERHWKTNSFDLFQRIDRTANLIYADKLGLNYAIYSGTLEEDSRPFCIARVTKVFDRSQIKAWEDLEFQGKPKIGYDPFVDCGGFNCRHHLSWISDGIAEHLTKK